MATLAGHRPRLKLNRPISTIDAAFRLDSQQDQGHGGASGALRRLAVIGIVALAGMTILLVLDLIPRDVFRETLVQVLLITGIAITARDYRRPGWPRQAGWRPATGIHLHPPASAPTRPVR